MATAQHKNPCPGGHEIYTSGRPFLCHHKYTFIHCFSELWPEVESVFKEIHQF